jgi:hypothetical protein
MAEHAFGILGAMKNMDERFEGLRRSAACAQLNREQISELVAITANLLAERRRIRAVLHRLPESFAEVRLLVNELSRTLR